MDQVLWIIGHDNGKADLYLKDEPEAEHQFQWVDPADKTRLTTLQMKGYSPVNKTKWEKHAFLWEWNAEDKLFFGGQIAYARPKEKWLADEAKREAMKRRARDEDERQVANVPDGLIATDAEGNAIKKRGRPRKGI